MSRLHSFYCKDGRTATGLRLEQVLAWDNAKLESNHSYIQWLFPLPERSKYNLLAPRLTASAREELLADERFAPNMRRAFARMCAFYGFAVTEDGLLALAAGFPERARVWLTPRNHNFLRLTRIMRSTRLLGLDGESASLFAALQELYEGGYAGTIGERTMGYWERSRN